MDTLIVFKLVVVDKKPRLILPLIYKCGFTKVN